MYNERDEAFHLVDLHPPLTIRASQGVYLEDLLNEPMAHFPGIGWMIPPTTGCRKSTHRRFPFSAYPGGRDLVGSMTAYGCKHSSASKQFLFFPIFGLESRLQPPCPLPVRHGYKLANDVLNRKCLTA